MLYTLLKRVVGIFFNTLNVVLAGNLPPFGCVCIIVEEHDKYLVIERPEGGYVFPGGFMRWRENPEQTAAREGSEETGLQLEVSEFIGFSSTVSERFTRMSTLTLIFQARVVGGELKSSIEGKARWRTRGELPFLLDPQHKGVFEHFLHSRRDRLVTQHEKQAEGNLEAR